MKDSLDIIADEVRICKKCDLCKGRTNAVPGEGTPNAQVMFIGEGPGAEEDKQGRPFVGRSGKLLREMIRMVGLKEEEVFIANVVKCRPPGNRDPKPEEIAACRPYLDRQIAVMNPKVMVSLGRHAMERELPGMKISDVHGKSFHRKNGRLYMPLYHPAVALYSPKQKDVLIEDMKKLPKLIQQI
ncbi:MAG: uracil-DNA glycosylase [bacterium]|nr:uracil-DNA glycosylase [bacterium]